MKLLPYISAAAVIISVAACDGKKGASNDASNGLDSTQAAANNAAFAERDSLIALFNDISGDLIQIKQVESIVTLPGNLSNESGKSVPQLRDDLAAIQSVLQERRQRLAELEQKLNNSSGENSQLQQMINNLKTQMAQSEQTIASLTEQLAQANSTIAGLNTKVDSLNVSVANVTAEKTAAEQKNLDLTNELNRCYYVIGTKDELKKHKIIETGFLRKTKIMQGDYEASYFTTADRRAMTTLPLYSKKAKVLTNQPTDSYTIVTEKNGNKTLNITNPNRFWGASNYLVVQTD